MTALVQFFDSDGATALTSFTFPDISSGQNGRPKKFGVLSLSDRILANVQQLIQAIAGNDGSTMVFHAADTATLSPPWGSLGPPDVSVSAPGAGGVFAATGTYGYKVAWINANGETVGSFEALATITATTQKVTLTWNTPPPPGTTGAKIYRTSTPGTYTSPALRATIGVTNTYTDDGSAVGAGAPSTTNTTAGWALTAVLSAPAAGGVWGATGNYFWRVVAYDANGIELANSFEATVNVDNTTKSVALTWTTVPGAASIKVFRSTSSGVYGSPALVALLGGGATTYTDLGTAATAASLTTTPTYGIPPTINTQAAIAEGNINIEQMYFFWVQLQIPIATPETGNPRLAYETAQET